VFPVKEVPELPRGKGNKLFDIAAKKFASREDFLTGTLGLSPERMDQADFDLLAEIGFGKREIHISGKFA